jgi:hypothetical protein
MEKPIFQNNDLSNIWDKLDSLSGNGNNDDILNSINNNLINISDALSILAYDTNSAIPNGLIFDYYYNSIESGNHPKSTDFTLITNHPNLDGRMHCTSGVLKKLFFSLDILSQPLDLYLIGYKNSTNNIFYITPISNFIASTKKYSFNFSNSVSADNNDNVISFQINNIELPSFHIFNDIICFVLSNGSNPTPIGSHNNADVTIIANYSLKLKTV